MTRIALVLTLLCAAVAAADVLATFDDYPLAPDSYYNGSDYAGGFTSSGVFFPNEFTDWGGGWVSWNGWSVSNMTDTTTPGFTNQYSAWTGSGYESANYGVAYGGGTTIDLPVPTTVSGAYLTNTTYAALAMLNGDWFLNKFGGADGTVPSWFAVTIEGLDAGGASTGSIMFYLADYRSDVDYIVDEWTWVDLSSLGTVSQLSFSFSADPDSYGTYGLNVPAYFAMDNLTVGAVPEPLSLTLLALATLFVRRGR